MSAIEKESTQQGANVDPSQRLDAEELSGRDASAQFAQVDGARNRYFDALRAVALLRVLLFHLFSWTWLPLIFPSMGVMFAMAGSLMASSLDRSKTPSVVIRRRLRRLLPPLWAFGAVLVPVMFITGWTATIDGAQSPGWSMLAWLFPITEPPASDIAYEWALPLWYLRTYLWLVLISPALLWLWRHWPKVMMTLPFLSVLLLVGGLVQVGGAIGDSAVSMLTYVTCWMIGFAHHDNKLQQWRLQSVLAVGALLAAAGVIVAVRYPLAGSEGIAVGDIPVATTLFSLGFSMVLLRLPLKFSSVNRIPMLNALLDAVNRRAMTIYIWGNMSIWLALTAMDRFGMYETLPELWWPSVSLALTLLVVAVIVLIIGWVEDLAARRQPQLIPVGGAMVRSGDSRRGPWSDTVSSSAKDTVSA